MSQQEDWEGIPWWDYDFHMTAIGQSQITSAHKEKVVSDFQVGVEKILYHGCGTGVEFDFLSSGWISPYAELIIADFSGHYLKRAKQRIGARRDLRAIHDNILDTGIHESVDILFLTLVLEHLDGNWEQGLDNMLELDPRIVFPTIQHSNGNSVWSTYECMPDSIKRAMQRGTSTYVPPQSLIDHMNTRDYALKRTYKDSDKTGKIMETMVFEKAA